MMQKFAIALGGGLAAALLFASTNANSAQSAVLGYLAPLPLMIVAIGWGLPYGALGGVIAVAAVALLVGPLSAALCAAVFTIPSWLLSLGAVLRPGALLRRIFNAPESDRLPTGALLVFVAALSALSALIAFCATVFYYNGFQPALDAMMAEIADSVKEALGQDLALPAGLTEQSMLKSVAYYLPAGVAAMTTAMFSLNLYVAGRLIHISLLRPQPWRSLSQTLLLPQWLAFGLAACLALGFSLPEPFALAALIIAAPMATAFVLQGLAVIHAMTRGLLLRGAMLAGVYITLFIISRSALTILACLGVLESFFMFRANALISRPPP